MSDGLLNVLPRGILCEDRTHDDLKIGLSRPPLLRPIGVEELMMHGRHQGSGVRRLVKPGFLVRLWSIVRKNHAFRAFYWNHTQYQRILFFSPLTKKDF